jgi:hypothetical protein
MQNAAPSLSGAPQAAQAGEVADLTLVPHFMQNAAPLRSGAPQARQVCPAEETAFALCFMITCVPQPGQNFSPAFSFRPHFLQYIILPHLSSTFRAAHYMNQATRFLLDSD